MSIHKGSNVLKELVKTNNNYNLKIYLIGKSNDIVLEKNTNNYIGHG